MKKFLLLFALFSVNFVSFSQNNYESNQVIILLKGGTNINNVLQYFNGSSADIQLELNRTLSRHSHIYLLEFDSLLTTVPSVINLLKTDERIVFAQPNHNNIQIRTTVPNDLEYPIQWSVGSTETARIFAPEAWDITTDGLTANGDTIVMAVVDGGVDIQHIDLNLFKNRHEIPNNGIDDDHNGYVDDYDGWNAYTQSGVITSDDHGTHIAGTIGARTNNNEGIAGVVWGGKILPINASSGLESVVVEGYGYALELRSTYNRTNGDSGAFVVATNSSFGVDRADPANYPIWCAFYDSLGAEGILSMAATTNQGLDVDILGDVPTTCPSNFIIAVSNIDQNGTILGGYGATQIDVAAPGTDIRSTIPGHRYGYKTGTSMATPHVVGVVGAMYSAMCGFNQSVFRTHPDSIALWVKQSLLESVDSVPNLIGKNNTNGRLNMFKAVLSMQTIEVDISHTKVLASSSSSNDGEITAIPTGGNAPYSFEWSNGGTTATISQLAAGTYTVTVTENYGCSETNQIDLWTVGLEELANSNSFLVSPNPNEGAFIITFQNELKQGNTLQIYDAVGQLVLDKNIQTLSNKTEVQTHLKAGIYFVRINNKNTQSIIIK